jgi:hypothetical protein
MGILADLFAATDANARKYEERLLSRNLGDEYDRAEFKGLTDLNFGMLWALIDGVEFDFDKYSLEEVIPPEESWLFRFPPVLVQKLEGLTESDVDKFAESWARTEELACQPSDVRPIIEQLVRLAGISKRRSLGLFLWGSL